MRGMRGGADAGDGASPGMSLRWARRFARDVASLGMSLREGKEKGDEGQVIPKLPRASARGSEM